MANTNRSSYQGLSAQPIWLISLINRLIRRAATSITHSLRHTQSRPSTAGSLLTRILTCCCRPRLCVRTESLHRQNSFRQEVESEQSISGSSASPLNNYDLFRSPSVLDAIDKIRSNTASASPASRCARRLLRRLQIATGINLGTAEEIVAIVEELKHDEQSSNRSANSSQKHLEGLFIRYLRLHAPDSGVALSFLNAMDIHR